MRRGRMTVLNSMKPVNTAGKFSASWSKTLKRLASIPSPLCVLEAAARITLLPGSLRCRRALLSSVKPLFVRLSAVPPWALRLVLWGIF